MTERLLLQTKPPDLPAALKTLRTPFYLHQPRAALWKGTLSTALVLVTAGMTFALVLWFGGRASFAEWFLFLFLLPFFLILLRPHTWKAPIAMAADDQGLHFICRRESEERLCVPWSDIGPMTIERHASGGGMIRTVVLTIAVHSSFWDAALQSRVLSHLLQREDPPGYRRLPLGNQGIHPGRTLAALEALASRSRGEPQS